MQAATADSTLKFLWDGKSLALSEDVNFTFKVNRNPWGAYWAYDAGSKYRQFVYMSKENISIKSVGEVWRGLC